MTILKCPEIRFKNDDGNNYPNWEDKKLDNVFKFYKGKGISKIELSEEGIPCIIYGELYTKYREVIGVVKSKTNIKKELLFMSEIGDILIPSSGETQKDIATASTVMEKNVALGGDINILRSKETINSPYVSYYLKHIKNIEISKLSQGNSVVHLYSKQLSNLKIEIPSLEEQQKIGDFFMLLDKRIEQQEQKIALLKDYKKAMMQKIFSQKIRFKDENGNDYPDWEEKMLGEIGVFYRGHSYKATDVSSEGLLVLRSNNISNDSITLNTGLQYVTKKCNNEIILENNDIVICMANGSKNLVGKSGIFHKENEFQTVTAGAFCSIYRTQNSLSRYLFQTDKYKKYLSILFSGTNINNLKNSDLEELKFKLPKRAEEERIFLLFQKLDINIEKQEGILENLKNQKEVLLQKMFI